MIEERDEERFRRELRALTRKANDAEGFAQAVALADELDAELHAAARRLAGEGFSAAELARPLGVTRQAFHKRWLAAFRSRRRAEDVQLPGQRTLADAMVEWS